VSASEHTHPDPRAWERWETPPGVPDKGLLELLAADAAGRATAMLAGSTMLTEDPLTENPLIDAVRMLATASGTRHTTQAAHLTGIPEDDLRRLVLAYRHGGTAGVSAARAATPCGTKEMAAAANEVRRRRTFAVGELSVDAGTITDTGAGVRLRLGPDGRWYPFTLARKQWWPASGANASAGAAYQAAAHARLLRRANN
jgi:hypothetical protein